MDQIVKACVGCTQTCCLIHGKNKSCAVPSFFKIMFGHLFSKVLFLPPTFAYLAPVQDGQSAILEDSSGQIWEVKFQKSNENLIFRQGWSTFASDHNLQLGELLIFFMTKQWHFVVKIYGRTSCERLDFSNHTKRRRKKKMINSSTERGLASDDKVETNSCVPVHKEDPGDEMDFRVSRDLDVPEREGNMRFNFDEWMNEAIEDVACVDHRATDDFKDDDDKDDDDFYEFTEEAPSGGVPHKGSPSFLTVLDTNVVNEVTTKSGGYKNVLFDEGSKENISGLEIKGCLVGKDNDRTLPSSDRDFDDKNLHCTEKVVQEISGSSNVPKIFQSGESSKVAKRTREQSVDTQHNRVHQVVVKTEIDDSDENYAMADDPIKFPPMLATCAHKHFIELPDTLPFPKIKGSRNTEKKIVYIRDSARNIWPVLYHEKQSTQFLTSGVDYLIEASQIKSGDKCVFTTEDEAEGIYSLRVL